MHDKDIATIVSLGYTVEQAKVALIENGGNVDDAIDDLFSRGRANRRSHATPPQHSSVNDSIRTRAHYDSYATPSFSLMALGGSANVGAPQRHRNEKRPAVSRQSPPSSARRSDLQEHVNVKARSGDIQRGTSIGTGRLDTPFRDETGVTRQKKRTESQTAKRGLTPAYQHVTIEDWTGDAKGSTMAGTYGMQCHPYEKQAGATTHSKKLAETIPVSHSRDERKIDATKDKDTTQSKAWLGVEQGFESNDNSSSGASTPPSRRLDAHPTAPQSTQVAPGAFPVGGGDSVDLQDEVATASVEPSLRRIEAELVDPERQQQDIEQRLAQELEAEHQRAQVAEVISEDELRKCRWRRVVGVVGFVLVAFAIALGVALTRPSETVETQAPTAAPTFPPTPQEIIDLIQPHSFDDGASLYDTSSPQSAAARWLADDAYLETYNTQRKLQRYALVTLYYSTNGDQWHDKQDWMADMNECQWWPQVSAFGSTSIKCDDESGITEFTIDKNNLDGTLPEEIAFLSDSLFSLEMEGNGLQGELPSTLGLLTKLATLELAENRFTGRIPTEVGRLTLLQDWTITENDLIAPLPSEIGLLAKLQEFHAEENSLTGHLPKELGLLADLKKELALTKNNFTGPIPSELGLLLKLRTFELNENSFTGTIPTEIGLLALLEELMLAGNKLIGPLPSELGGLSKLDKFDAHKNRLGSQLPTELGLLTAIRHSILLGENGFIGPIPSELGVLSNLEWLSLGRNNITGTMPSSIDGFSNLLELVLHNNALTGTIPIVLDSLYNLRKIHLYNNSFSGPFTCPTQVTDCYVSCFIPDNASCRILPP